MRFLALAAFVLTTAPAFAQTAPGDPAAGRDVAMRLCAGCHAVADRQPNPAMDGVPAFVALARDPAVTEARLRAFLQRPHPPMPDLALTRRDIDDVVSYIVKLKNP